VVLGGGAVSYQPPHGHGYLPPAADAPRLMRLVLSGLMPLFVLSGSVRHVTSRIFTLFLGLRVIKKKQKKLQDTQLIMLCSEMDFVY